MCELSLCVHITMLCVYLMFKTHINRGAYEIRRPDRFNLFGIVQRTSLGFV